MSHVVAPLLLDLISTCGYLLPIELQTIGINTKQQHLGASSLCLEDQGSFEELQKPRFAKAGPHEPCDSPFSIGTNFDVWISPANQVPNHRNQRQTAAIGSLWPLLKRSGKFRRAAETSSCKGGPYEPCEPPFAIGPNFDVWISPANRVPNHRNQRQTAVFGSIWSLLTRSVKFSRVTETSFCETGTTWLMWSVLCY